MHTEPFAPFSLRLSSGLRLFDRPQVMGIVNATPDSFYERSRTLSATDIEHRVTQLINDGADWIDVGACSSRPGATPIPVDEELERLQVALTTIRNTVGREIPVSVDTYRAEVARVAVTELGADIVNDISAGLLDPEMIDTVAKLGVPYIAMHSRGGLGDAGCNTDYSEYGGDVAAGVVAELSERLRLLSLAGVADVIIDPGFGFAKTVGQNYRLLARLSEVRELCGNLPLLVGISRKSMIYKPLQLPNGSAGALNGTTALHITALLQGAGILRVHDAAAASQVVRLASLLQQGDRSFDMPLIDCDTQSVQP